MNAILEVDLAALAHNYFFLKSLIKKNTQFLAVVKANAYGSESAAIAHKLQDLGVDYFAVAYAEEGKYLRKAGIIKPILVFHAQEDSYDTIIKYCLEPSIYTLKKLKAFEQVLKNASSKKYPIHLKINTGLNRIGLEPNEVNEAIKVLKNSEYLKLKSVYSHLAESEDLTDKSFTIDQIEKFKIQITKIKNELEEPFITHLANTSGLLNYPEAHFDMVRSGIGLYGFGNDEAFDKKLIPIGRLKTKITQITQVKPGSYIGYNRAFEAKTEIRSATLPVGYADGIAKIFSKQNGYVFIRGKKAPILGKICMDMMMVNVTDIPCEEGDEVIIFDKNHSAAALAEDAGTISYELITSIGSRVKRVFIYQ